MRTTCRLSMVGLLTRRQIIFLLFHVKSRHKSSRLAYAKRLVLDTKKSSTVQDAGCLDEKRVKRYFKLDWSVTSLSQLCPLVQMEKREKKKKEKKDSGCLPLVLLLLFIPILLLLLLLFSVQPTQTKINRACLKLRPRQRWSARIGRVEKQRMPGANRKPPFCFGSRPPPQLWLYKKREGPPATEISREGISGL